MGRGDHHRAHQPPSRRTSWPHLLVGPARGKRLQLLNEAVRAASRITALLYGVDERLRSRQNTRTPDHGSRASSSVRSPSGGFSTSAVEWRPQRGQRLFLPSHCFRSSPSPCLPSCGRKSSPATVDRYDGQKSPVRQRDARQPSSASTHGAVCQLTLRPRVFDERLAGLLAARRGGGFATSDLSDSMLRRSASIRLMTFCADG